VNNANCWGAVPGLPVSAIAEAGSTTDAQDNAAENYAQDGTNAHSSRSYSSTSRRAAVPVTNLALI